MTSLIETLSHFIRTSSFTAVFIDALIKSFVVLTVAALLTLCWRRASAATRHWIWFLAVVSLPFLPLLSSVLPSWHRPLWKVSSGVGSGNEMALAIELAPVRPSALPDRKTAAVPAEPARADHRSSAGQFSARVSANGLVFPVLAWCAGVVLLLAWIAAGQFRLGKLSRSTRRVEEIEWTALLQECSERLGLRRRVKLCRSGENLMPLTWGWLRPVVLLPADAGAWPVERRRVVLLHELAHVKRWDCLTQLIARFVCALFWFNPLVWLAARRMCVERERACDDLVLNGGCKASEYAGHLVDIARSFRPMPQSAAIAMARSSGLEKRITSIVDNSRVRTSRPAIVWAVLVLASVLIYGVGGWSADFSLPGTSGDPALAQRQLDQIKQFSALKLKQSQLLAAGSAETISPEFQRFFDAAASGDWRTVTNMYASFHARHHQYERVKGIPLDVRLTTSFWGPVLEISLAYEHLLHCEAKYTQIAVDDLLHSIPPGSIYFGGTDPGRALPTAFSKSQPDADPFYTLTQNALADGTYLAYLRNTYGERRHWLIPLSEACRADATLQSLNRAYQDSCETFVTLLSTYPADDPRCQAAEDTNEDLRRKFDKQRDQVLADLQARTDAGTKAKLLNELPRTIYIPTDDESQKAFAEYTAEAARRLQEHKLNPGENVRMGPDGKVQVSGQVAVMSINALIAKTLFDKNPDREFYVEESFPLDWMYPHLEPHGPILKINRQPLAELSAEVLQQDHDYWQHRVNDMLGDWLTDDTPVSTVAAFAEKVYVRKDLSGFTGDPRFVSDDYAPKMFSKWRSAIGGVYAWRLGVAPGALTPAQYLPKNDAERRRMTQAAEIAYRQAFAICPQSPEAVFRYVNLLVSQKRNSDALLVAETASHILPDNGALKDLVARLRSLK